jgi:hypothetical protein
VIGEMVGGDDEATPARGDGEATPARGDGAGSGGGMAMMPGVAGAVALASAGNSEVRSGLAGGRALSEGGLPEAAGQESAGPGMADKVGVGDVPFGGADGALLGVPAWATDGAAAVCGVGGDAAVAACTMSWPNVSVGAAVAGATAVGAAVGGAAAGGRAIGMRRFLRRRCHCMAAAGF